MTWEQTREPDYDKLEWVNEDCRIKRLVDFCDPKPDETIVDFGTGTGIVAAALSERCKKVIGIDISENMIRNARKRDNIEYVVADGEAAELFSEADCLVARMSLHHLCDPAGFVGKCRARRIVICESVPPPGCLGWYQRMMRMKEARWTFTPNWLVTTLEHEGYHDISLDISTNVGGIKNWLEHSGLSEKAQSRIIAYVCYAPQYVRTQYQMNLVEDDIIMTWPTAIVKGYR